MVLLSAIRKISPVSQSKDTVTIHHPIFANCSAWRKHSCHAVFTKLTRYVTEINLTTRWWTEKINFVIFHGILHSDVRAPEYGTTLVMSKFLVFFCVFEWLKFLLSIYILYLSCWSCSCGLSKLLQRDECDWRCRHHVKTGKNEYHSSMFWSMKFIVNISRTCRFLDWKFSLNRS